MNLFELKRSELEDIIDFYNFIEEYGYVFHGERQEELNQEFKNIINSISKIKEIMNDNYNI